MTETDQVAIFRVTTGVDWPAVSQLAGDVSISILQKALLSNKADADDALSVARGAAQFLKLFNAEIQQIQRKYGAKENQEITYLPEDTPLAIL
jgi:hypothetical protein